ncbi:AT-hook motif nuclear-localized protein 28-like [Telopea speciosissima]|uniref:AT-hook motif nuclear-localized protein 28-like n=1 Tax=Telopea speciosissima TaxID=54955 RepID=UPI001CC3D661|nr:AT-hook motif nuclear-localized protein 28-like [Telopea speciosissima]
MKSEYDEGKGGGSNNSMFAKLHQQQKLHQLHHHQHHHVVTPECHHPSSHQPQYQTSEDDESRSSGGGGGGATTRAIVNHHSSEVTTITPKGDGATIEVVRRPRGRPPGSKNKPKPPVFITRDTTDSNAMRPHVLEVPGGLDVVDALARFVHRRNIGLCVLTSSGTVANVTLRQPSATPGATVTFHGRFDILSMSATLLPPASSSIPSSANAFSISLAGPSGQIVGGSVAGSLLAAGTVYIVAAGFSIPSYHRLSTEDELQSPLSGKADQSPSGSGGGGEGSHDHPGPLPVPAESCGVSIYSCHLPSDVIWAPTARQPPPPPHF